MKLREVFHPLHSSAHSVLFTYRSARGEVHVVCIGGRAWKGQSGDVRNRDSGFVAKLHGVRTIEPFNYLVIDVPDDAEVERGEDGRFVILPRPDDERWRPTL